MSVVTTNSYCPAVWKLPSREMCVGQKPGGSRKQKERAEREIERERERERGGEGQKEGTKERERRGDSSKIAGRENVWEEGAKCLAHACLNR